MTPTQSRIFRDSLPSIVTAVVLSITGGSLSAYVTFRVLEHRVSAIEARVAAVESANVARDDKLSQIASDVAYIRGKLERSP